MIYLSLALNVYEQSEVHIGVFVNMIVALVPTPLRLTSCCRHVDVDVIASHVDPMQGLTERLRSTSRVCLAFDILFLRCDIHYRNSM